MKLSIITINYNNCEGLRKTIDSVMIQTWQNFEWIFVDGASTDGSCELIESTASLLKSQGWNVEQFSGPDDPASYISKQRSFETPAVIDDSSLCRCLLWCSEPDKGIYNAMNKGIAMAKGEYCLFLNSGDCLFEANTLEEVAPHFGSGDFLCGYANCVDVNGNILHCKKTPRCYHPGDLIRTHFPHQSTFIKTKLLKKRLYKEHIKISADWEQMLFELNFNNAKYFNIPKVLSRMESGGVSVRNVALARFETESVLNDCYGWVERNKIALDAISKKDEGTNQSLSLEAYVSIVNKRYSQREFIDLFTPYKKEIISNGTFVHRLINYLSINGWIKFAYMICLLRKFK